MSKIDNPFLKQLISNIGQKASTGRMGEVSWGILSEAKKTKKSSNVIKLKEEKPIDEKPEDDKTDELPELPSDGEKGGEDKAPIEKPELPMDKTPTEEPSQDEAPAADDGEDVDQAKADAAEKKAELEKAKAEKDQAEKEIKKNAYIRLNSNEGVHFLLGKLLDHAFKTDSIDSLAGEMVQKLKIEKPEDFSMFSEEVASFMTIPGMGELVNSMKAMANKAPENPEETGAE